MNNRSDARRDLTHGGQDLQYEFVVEPGGSSLHSQRTPDLPVPAENGHCDRSHGILVFALFDRKAFASHAIQVCEVRNGSAGPERKQRPADRTRLQGLAGAWKLIGTEQDRRSSMEYRDGITVVGNAQACGDPDSRGERIHVRCRRIDTESRQSRPDKRRKTVPDPIAIGRRILLEQSTANQRLGKSVCSTHGNSRYVRQLAHRELGVIALEAIQHVNSPLDSLRT